MDRSLASEEAQRWLGTAEKLLAARDLLGAKSFAIRVREAFPRLESAADDVVAVADTVLAGETRIGNSGHPQRDWYAVLGLARFTQNLEAVANQYRRLALVLNPHRNRLPFADEAFRLVTDAWSVLSNPSKKAFFDNELAVYSRFDFSAGTQSHHTQTHTHLQEHQFLQRNNHPQPQPQPQPQLHHHQPQQQHHRFFNQNPAPPPPPPQQFHFQPQQHRQNQQPPPQQQQRQQSQAALRKSPKRKGVVVEEERPNLNSAAESTRPVRPAEVSPPPPRPPPAPQREQTPPLEPEGQEGPTFWTACPFCYILYEYPKVYEDCVLRCQSCKRAFTAVAVLAPPVAAEGEGGPNYFCCWGFFPLGFTGKAGVGARPGWTPFSPMFAAPVQDQGMGGGGGGAGKDNKRKRGGSLQFVYKDDDLFVEISESDISESDGESDCDWRNTRRMNKKSRTSKGKVSAARSAKTTVAAGTPSPARVTRSSLSQALASNGAASGEKADGLSTKAAAAAAPSPAKGETSRKTKAAGTGGKKRGGADWGRLDLNVEFNNEVEEPAGASAAVTTTTTNRGSGVGHGGGGEDDNIEQIGFFEGLDEFLSSLPILNVVGDDKVKAT